MSEHFATRTNPIVVVRRGRGLGGGTFRGCRVLANACPPILSVGRRLFCTPIPSRLSRCSNRSPSRSGSPCGVRCFSGSQEFLRIERARPLYSAAAAFPALRQCAAPLRASWCDTTHPTDLGEQAHPSDGEPSPTCRANPTRARNPG